MHVHGTYLTIREIVVVFNDFNELKYSAFLYCCMIGGFSAIGPMH